MLSKLSVKKPYTVVVAVVLAIILGVVTFTEMTPDLLPSIDLPYAIVMTTYVGASPEEVEQTVTRPVEQSMATINNIKDVSSVSNENVSMVILEFNDSVNMDAVTIDIREKLDLASANWKDEIGTPTIMKLNPDMLPIITAAVDVKGMSSKELSQYVNDKVIPSLESVEGVASVTGTGLIDHSVNVVINQKKIDKINKKLKESVQKKMDKASDKIDSAKDKLDDGEKKVTSQTDSFNSGIAQGESKISDAKLQLLLSEIQISNSEAELNKKETELKTSEKQLDAKEKELKEAEKKLSSKETKEGEKKAKEGLKTVNAAIATLEEQYTKLVVNKTSIEASIQQTMNQTSLTEVEKNAMLQSLNANLATVNKGISELNTKKEELETQKETLNNSLKTIQTSREQVTAGKKEIKTARTQIAQGKTAITKARKQLASGKTQVTTGKTALAQQEEKLNKTKTETTSKLNDASSQIKDGQKELSNQTSEFEKQKETALDSANVDNTITSDMVSNLLKAQNFSMPAGYVTEGDDKYMVRVGDKIKSMKELKNMVLFDLKVDGLRNVKLSDVADVFETSNADEIYAKVNGNDAVLLSIQKQNNYSTAAVSQKVKDKLSSLEKDKKGLGATYLMDQGIYINMVVDSVLNNLLVGGILAIIILFIFLRDIKPTFIIACSIPISVMVAIILMYFSGITLNIISLSGLAVGVGMLVDNSVVVIENIYRLRNKGVSAIKAAVTGAVQVAGAIIASTLTTICVFLPIVFVKGITKQLFTDMALTIAYSLGASLIVALTLVPMMSSRMLKNTKEKKHRVLDALINGYDVVIRKVLKHRFLMLLAVVIILVGSIVGAVRQGTAFMPDMDSTQITATLTMPEGSLLKDTKKSANEAMKRIEKIDGVDKVGAMSGNGNSMSMSSASDNVETASLYVLLKEDKKKTSIEIAKEIETACKGIKGKVTAEGSSMDMSSLGGSGISVRVTGTDLDELQKIAKDVAKKLKKVEGTKEVSDGIDHPSDEFRIVVDKAKAAKKGLTVATIYSDIKTLLTESTTATTLSQSGDEYDVNVANEGTSKLTRKKLKKHVIKTKDQTGAEISVKLSDVATFKEATSLSSIRRSSSTRYIDVAAQIKDGYNIGLVSQKVEKEFKNYSLPNGYELEFTGENETINESLGELVKMLLLAVVFIYLIMVAQFQSLLSPFIVLFTIPLAFTGGFLGLWLTGMEVSVISMIGFVMLSGIVVNNGIVLVDYINQLRLDGMEKREAIVEAGKVRMRPILMTALTTVLGLSSMALAKGMGSDMMQPIAIVTIGGLIYATIMTLFVVPVMYDILNRRHFKKISEEELEILDET
ncbi:RND multidrug efflux transporter [Lachnospiraceae bacterium KM106-2]|nr:RND multidrug efflux transporter [Lachnospiraceae bacterium KM106-2]